MAGGVLVFQCFSGVGLSVSGVGSTVSACADDLACGAKQCSSSYRLRSFLARALLLWLQLAMGPSLVFHTSAC